MLRNEITVIDNALTRPWTVTRSYRRERDYRWSEYVCAANNQHVVIGKEDYFLSADGLLMPVRKDQNLRTCETSIAGDLRRPAAQHPWRWRPRWAKSSIIGHLFAGEKGVRSSVRRDNSLRGTGRCG